MNGVIHTCTHGDGKSEFFHEENVFREICSYLDFLFQFVRPRKYFVIATDGVAPRAKMNQQRQRRFRAAVDTASRQRQLAECRSAGGKGKEEEEVDVDMDMDMDMEGDVEGDMGKEGGSADELFDSNAISPGTTFMRRLEKHCKAFVDRKCHEDSYWKRCRVIFSGDNVPGEGEHKIMNFIRARKAGVEGFEQMGENEIHCLYGLDADLIILGLLSHEPNFMLLREEVVFQKGSKRARDEQQRVKIRITFSFCLLLSAFVVQPISF
jgi:5'-3' exoribonuclease 1